MKQSYLAICSIILAFGVSACTSSNSVIKSSSSSSQPSNAGGVDRASAKELFSNASELSYTATGGGAYRISPNDKVEVDVFRVPELSGKTRRVGENGRISLPLVGSIQAAGLTQQQLEKKLVQHLSKNFLQNPQVSVYIKEQNSKEVTVDGRVKRSGRFSLKSATTISQTIAMAGGFTDLADPSNVLLFRPKKSGGFKVYTLDLKAIRTGKKRDPYIAGNDLVVVHESGSRVWLQRATGIARGFINPFSF